MRIKIILLIAFFPILLFGQYKNKNVFYVELFGKAGLYSLNYEHYFYEKGIVKMGFRAGVSYIGAKNLDFAAVPYGLQFLFGQKKGHFEISVGQTFAYSSQNNYYSSSGSFSSGVYGFDNSVSFGYKKLPKGGEGFVFGAYGMLYLPTIYISQRENREGSLFINDGGFYTLPYIGVQFGYMF